MKQTAEEKRRCRHLTFENEIAVERGGKWDINFPKIHRPNTQWRIYVLMFNDEISVNSLPHSFSSWFCTVTRVGNSIRFFRNRWQNEVYLAEWLDVHLWGLGIDKL
jgi:hypothetical protein